MWYPTPDKTHRGAAQVVHAVMDGCPTSTPLAKGRGRDDGRIIAEPIPVPGGESDPTGRNDPSMPLDETPTSIDSSMPFYEYTPVNRVRIGSARVIC